MGVKRTRRGRRAPRRRGGRAPQRRGGRAPQRRSSRWLVRAVSIGTALALLITIVPVALLRFVPPPTSAFMLRSRYADPATGEACRRVAYDWVPLERIAGGLARAVLVAEDQRFFEHGGFDTKAIGDALGDYVRGERMRGASTLTQQVAKNLFLWPGRSLLRKGLEAWLALWIELLWPKHRILEVHLNVAQFGPCVFGAEAASRRYFGLHARDLSLAQATRLAVVLPSPGRMRVDDPGPFALERQREVLAELRRPDGPPSYLRGL
jgi:monofunctional biosynthetic peptidoglycan transglycosylase